MKLHFDLISQINRKVADQAKRGDHWAQRHVLAWNPLAPLPAMIIALALYADQHHNRYESPIGEDGVLGEEWKSAVEAVRGLLNGELGDLDGGTLDKMLCGMLSLEGLLDD